MAVATTAKPKSASAVVPNRRPITLEEIDALTKLSEILFVGLSASGNAKEVFAKILFGREIGLSDMQSVANVYIVKGKPCMYGDAPLSLVRSSGKLADISERIEGTGDSRVAVCVVKRMENGTEKTIERKYSVADAKRANLWVDPATKDFNAMKSAWYKTPERMLMFRARGFALRDLFGDVLLGLAIGEELDEIRDAEIISVKPASQALPAATAAPEQKALAAKPQQVEVIPSDKLPVAEEQLKQLAWYHKKINDKPKWAEMLKQFDATSAKSLTMAQADILLEQLKEAVPMADLGNVFDPKTEAELNAPASASQESSTTTQDSTKS